MRHLAALAGVVLVLAACGDSDAGPSVETVEGVVLEVNGDLETIESFVLRTDEGEVIEIVPAPDGDFRFPLAHLYDHLRTSGPLSVGLDRSVDPPRAVAIQDAGNPAWHTGDSQTETTTGTSRAPTSTLATTTTTPTATEADPGGVTIDLTITDGAVEGGVRREVVRIGDTVTLGVSGNTSDEVHIHGYDLHMDLDEGQGELTFEASIPGVLEVELEGTHTLVLQLEVS